MKADNFPVAEFACRDGCGYGRPHPLLRRRLRRLRELIGSRPIVIVSGIRCPVRNTALYDGRVTRSRHQSGEAADIREGLVRESQAREAGFTGIGLRNGWVVHVDVRDAEATVWTY